MIELTHEQWQAITHEENPTVIEPESKTAYAVVPKDEYDRQSLIKFRLLQRFANLMS